LAPARQISMARSVSIVLALLALFTHQGCGGSSDDTATALEATTVAPTTLAPTVAAVSGDTPTEAAVVIETTEVPTEPTVAAPPPTAAPLPPVIPDTVVDLEDTGYGYGYGVGMMMI